MAPESLRRISPARPPNVLSDFVRVELLRSVSQVDVNRRESIPTEEKDPPQRIPRAAFKFFTGHYANAFVGLRP